VSVGHSTGWCEKLCLWAILQSDARNCACGPFYRVMWETVPVGHSTEWCEKMCLWAILQGDVRKCACGPFYRMMWETVPVGHSTGWCEKLCLSAILQNDARNCAYGPFYRVMWETVPVGYSTVVRETVPVGHSTAWCEKLCLWAILQRDVRNCLWAILQDDARNCACGPSYRVMQKIVPVAKLQDETRHSLLSIFTFSWHFMAFEVPTAVNIQFNDTLAWDTAYWRKEISTFKKQLPPSSVYVYPKDSCRTLWNVRTNSQNYMASHPKYPKFMYTDWFWIRFLNLWFVPSECTYFVIEWLVTGGSRL